MSRGTKEETTNERIKKGKNYLIFIYIKYYKYIS